MCSSKVSGMDAKKKKKKQHDNAPAVASVLKTRVIKKELKKNKQKKPNSPISIQVDLCIAPQR